jgi:tetratricopeptide (TPR) repeat protein
VLQRSVEWLWQLFRRPGRTLAILSLVALIALAAGLVVAHLWAGYHYRAAQRAFERYRLPEAREHLEHCLQVWPSKFEIHLLAARTARRLGDLEAAELHLGRCQEIRGVSAPEVELEQILIRAERGGMDTVMPYLRSLVEDEHPDTPLILEAMSRGYMRAFRYGDAYALVSLWQDRWPDDIEANLFLGYINEQIGSQEQAVASFRRVLELDSDLDEARLRLADLLINRAAAAEAEEHLEYVARRRPEDLYIQTRLAKCLAALGRAEEAEEKLDRVLAELPGYRPAMAAKGELALALNRPAEAESWLRKALAADAADFHTQYSLAWSLRQQGKDQEARGVEDRIRVLQEDGIRIRKIIQEDINKSPNDPALRTEIGNILLRAGSEPEGVQWLHSALRQMPSYVPAHRALLAYFERVGQPERAAPHRRFLEGRGESEGLKHP